jgi:hypothetical protein
VIPGIVAEMPHALTFSVYDRPPTSFRAAWEYLSTPGFPHRAPSLFLQPFGKLIR